MQTSAMLAWLDRPLAADFLRFNLMLSLLIGAGQPGGRAAPAESGPQTSGGTEVPGIDSARLERHTSRAILATLGKDEQVVDGFTDPALPLFMPSNRRFEELRVACGLVVLGPAIRRIITRPELEALRNELSAAEVDFARTAGSRCWPGDDAVLPLPGGNVRACARSLGTGVLRHAAQGASKAVACRAHLRLADDADGSSLEVPPALTDTATALALARSILQELDPEWISLFPNPS